MNFGKSLRDLFASESELECLIWFFLDEHLSYQIFEPVQIEFETINQIGEPIWNQMRENLP